MYSLLVGIRPQRVNSEVLQQFVKQLIHAVFSNYNEVYDAYAERKLY